MRRAVVVAVLALGMWGCESQPRAELVQESPTPVAMDAPVVDKVNGVVEYVLHVDDQVHDVTGVALPKGIVVQRPEINHWSGHGVSLVHPANVHLVTEELVDGVQLTATDGAGSNLAIVIKPYVADVAAHMSQTEASLLHGFAMARPTDPTPLVIGTSAVHSFAIKAPMATISAWGTQLTPELSIIATLTVPSLADGAVLRQVLTSLKAGARPATPDLQLIHGGTVHAAMIGQTQQIAGAQVRVERRATVLRRWNGLQFEHDATFVVSEVPTPAMLSLQLSRSGVLVQFFLTEALQPADAQRSLTMAFPDAVVTDTTRTIGGTNRPGKMSRLSLPTGDLSSEVFSWKIEHATVAVMVQYEPSAKESAAQSIELVLGSLSVTP